MLPVGFDIKVNEKSLLVAGGLIVLLIWYGRRQVAAVAAAVNPISENNVFNKAAEGAGQAITGEKDWTPGGALYDLGHNKETNKPNFFGYILDAFVPGV